MQPWKDKLNNSGFESAASGLLATIDELPEDQLTEDVLPYLDWAEVVATMLKTRVAAVDPRLIHFPTLQAIVPALNEAKASIENWHKTSDINYIQSNLSSTLESLVSYSHAIAPPSDVIGFEDSIAKLRRSAARHATEVGKLIEAVESKQSSINQTLDEKASSVQSEIERVRQSTDSLKSEVNSIQATSAQIVSDQQTAFTNAETERSVAFNALLTEKQKELDTSIDSAKQSVQLKIKETLESVEQDVQSVEDSKSQVEKILEIVGEESLVGNYSKNANKERHDANFWRWVATGSFALAILFAFWFSMSADSSMPWQKIVAKTAIILSLGGLSTYSARQSSEHRRAQRDAETMSLQLAAVKPYLDGVDEPVKRDELLVKIASDLFGSKPDLASYGKESDDDQLSKAMETIVNLTAALKKN